MIYHRTEAVIDVDTSALDCVQANLAAVGNAVHGVRGEAGLGAFLRFRPRRVTPGEAPEPELPTIEPTLGDRLAAARHVLGLDHSPGVPHAGAPSLLRAISSAWLLVIADAYYLPWVPYHGHTHTSHSFAIRRGERGIELLDAYTNDTPWGPARPRFWVLTGQEAGQVLPAQAMTAVELRPAAAGPLPAPADAFDAAVADLTAACKDRTGGYLAAYEQYRDRAAALSRLTVETWLLARQRAAFATWLGTAGSRGEIPRPNDAPAQEQARRWAEAAEATYLAMRRAQRGRAVPGGVLARIADLLREDGPVLRSCAAPATAVAR